MLCAPDFVDGIMLSYGGEDGWGVKSRRVFRPARRVAAPGARSSVCDCIFVVFVLCPMLILFRI